MEERKAKGATRSAAALWVVTLTLDAGLLEIISRCSHEAGQDKKNSWVPHDVGEGEGTSLYPLRTQHCHDKGMHLGF